MEKKVQALAKYLNEYERVSSTITRKLVKDLLQSIDDEKGTELTAEMKREVEVA